MQHLLSVVGLSFGTLGATIVLAADWSTVEDILVKIGRKDPLFYRFPIIGYPFRQAKRLADLDRVSETFFFANQDIEKDDPGFPTLKRVVRRIAEKERLNLGTFDEHNIDDTDFERISLSTMPVPAKAGDTGGMNAYSILYDGQDDSVGWIRTGTLRSTTASYSRDLISKAGASLFVGGFLLQLIAELVSIPNYPTIEVPNVVIGVVTLCIVLSIPGLCEQMEAQ